MTLTVGSLFSGIGGLDLGLERAGMKVIWQSEIDPYCNKVLKKHWPEVINHGNIKDIDWGTVERPDIICGGYPCQPFSTAGKRRGTDDPRHLWPWVRDAISALRPKYAILENVRGHLSMGGLQVIGELAEIGYDAEWRVVSAAGVGAPHRRDRIIIVAYPNGDQSSNGRQCTDVPSQDRSWRDDGSGSGSDSGQIGLGSAGKIAGEMANSSELFGNGSNNNARISVGSETIPKLRDSSRSPRMANSDDSTGGASKRGIDKNGTQEIKERKDIPQFGSSGCCANVADSCEQQFNGRRHQHSAGEIEEWEAIQEPACRSGGDMAYSDGEQLGERGLSKDAGSQDRVWGHNGRSEAPYDGWQWWEVEPDVGRVADGIPSRVDRLKGLGNAVVPQVAEYIGRLVMAAELNNS